MKTLQLSDTVHGARDAFGEAGIPAPEVLFFLETGSRPLTQSVSSLRTIELAGIEALPGAWRSSELHTGLLGDARVWLLDDSPAEDSVHAPGTPAWIRAFPCWLAAACGATLCVHTSAGITLEASEGLQVGALALVKDHINLSGHTPLAGIGETPLGPLFPDQTRVHHAGLREQVLRRARERGIEAGEAVAACTLGPNLSTPAELGWYTAAGADVAVQDLAAPLIACAHAGLAALAVVALTDSGRDPLRLQQIVERSEACAPALEDLLTTCAGDFAEVARELEEEL